MLPSECCIIAPFLLFTVYWVRLEFKCLRTEDGVCFASDLEFKELEVNWVWMGVLFLKTLSEITHTTVMPAITAV